MQFSHSVPSVGKREWYHCEAKSVSSCPLLAEPKLIRSGWRPSFCAPREKQKQQKNPNLNQMQTLFYETCKAICHTCSWHTSSWFVCGHLPWCQVASSMSASSRKPWIHLHQGFCGTLASTSISALQCDTAKLPHRRQIVFLFSQQIKCFPTSRPEEPEGKLSFNY